MDEDIRNALADLKADVRGGFKDINARIDALVSHKEFSAEVRRIDAQHATLRRDFDNHEKAAAAHVAETRAADETVLGKAQAWTDAIRKELHGELQAFRSSTWRAVAITASIVGVLAAIVFGILNAIK